MPTTTYLLNTRVTGTSTQANDLLSGTAVSNAGPNGKVWVSATSIRNDGAIGNEDMTFTLFGRESGITVVPADSGFVIQKDSLAAQGRVVFYGQVRANEPLTLNIQNSSMDGATDINFYSVMVKTE